MNMFCTQMNSKISLFNYRLDLKQEQLQMKSTSFSNEKEAEKEEQHRKDKEKHWLEMGIKRQEKKDTELRRPRLDMDKVD